MAAVREMATKIKAVRRVYAFGVDNESWMPFVYVDLKKFLPPCFPQHAVVKLEEVGLTHPWLSGGAQAGGAQKVAETKASTRRLELAAWMAAWDRYTIAAVALNQMLHQDTAMHKSIVLEVRARFCGRRRSFMRCVAGGLPRGGRRSLSPPRGAV